MQYMSKDTRISILSQNIWIHNLLPLEKDKKSELTESLGSSYS